MNEIALARIRVDHAGVGHASALIAGGEYVLCRCGFKTSDDADTCWFEHEDHLDTVRAAYVAEQLEDQQRLFDSAMQQTAFSEVRFGGGSMTPAPMTADYNAWVTLANHVSRAMRSGAKQCRGRGPLFSERQATARLLWEMGYRPTPEQIAAEIERQGLR